MISHGQALFRLILYVAWTLVLALVQLVAVALGLGVARRIPVLYHRVCLTLFGIRVLRRGEPAATRSTLFISNHCGYLDIIVLGSFIPGSFISKAEIAHWPVFGLLARLQRTIFVDRQAVHSTAAQRDIMKRRLASGDNLILFPEGTSSDGNRILKFKSALFSVAETKINGDPVQVQPVSIAYTRLDGMPMGRMLRHYCAWFGDIPLLPHIWNLMGIGHITIEVVLHPTVTISEFSSRKELAAYCHDVIAIGVSEALSGRPPAPRTEAPDGAKPGGADESQGRAAAGG